MQKIKLSFVKDLQQEVPENDLTPLAMQKLPSGAISPSSYLKRQLELALTGLPGQLWKKGGFLKESNGWLHPEKIFADSWSDPARPWEEQAYYLRTLVLLAVCTKDGDTLAQVEKYMKKMVESREEDGWFGPQNLKYSHSEDPEEKNTFLDLWPHMVMCEAILFWYEYTQDFLYVELLQNFFHFCLNAPESIFLPEKKPGNKFSWLSSIQYPRACDILPSIYKVIELTKDKTLFPLVHRFYQKWHGEGSEFMCIHTVTFAQQFAYPAYYSRLAHEKYLFASSHYWYDQHMMVWGTIPRGGFCADENVRKGCTDPRYGMESCTFAELTRSFNYLGEMNMEAVWADRTEDILFNHYPASHTKDMKKVHYITCANQVMLDDYLYHNVANLCHMFAYTDTEDRCCLHNAALGWVLYVSYMLTKTRDDGLCAWLHGGYTAETFAGKEKTPVKCISETFYPFRDKIRFTWEMAKETLFPFYIRIPRWCKSPVVKLNGEKLSLEGWMEGGFLRMEKEWRNGDNVELFLPSEITVSENIRNGGVTVNKGALSYSLQIKEKENIVVSSKKESDPAKEIWDEKSKQNGNIWTELLPESSWNYGLLVEEGFTFEECPLPEEYPFYWETPPSIIKAKGRKIPNWKLQDHMCAPLQKSPVKSEEATEILTLIPMGCARLRLSVFPRISDSPWAREWKEVPENTSPDDRPPLRK